MTFFFLFILFECVYSLMAAFALWPQSLSRLHTIWWEAWSYAHLLLSMSFSVFQRLIIKEMHFFPAVSNYLWKRDILVAWQDQRVGCWSGCSFILSLTFCYFLELLDFHHKPSATHLASIMLRKFRMAWYIWYGCKTYITISNVSCHHVLVWINVLYSVVLGAFQNCKLKAAF